MYKLLIADDEAVERQALRYFIENSQLEIGQILECSNGTTTVQTSIAQSPDIILLDIKMPGLSGLEVMEKIVATNKNCKVIFSTAYSYFDYAIKALHLGAIDFMVKPVKKDQLISILNKAIDQLDTERSHESKHIQLHEVMRMLGKKNLEDMLLGHIDEEMLYYLDALGIKDKTAGNVFVITLKSPLLEDKKQQILHILDEDMAALEYRCIAKLHENYIVAVAFSPQPSLVLLMENNFKLIVTSIFRDLKAEYILGSGPGFDNLSGVSQAFIVARKQLSENIHFPSFISYELPNVSSNSLTTSQDLPPEVQGVCHFIEEHYGEKITLDNIASAIGYSKYYISRLFKQYKNLTIVDYLIFVRLSKAKELLLNGDFSIKQISYMIGYADPNYFTWTFKKHEGLSPVKYRYLHQHKNTKDY